MLMLILKNIFTLLYFSNVILCFNVSDIVIVAYKPKGVYVRFPYEESIEKIKFVGKQNSCLDDSEKGQFRLTDFVKYEDSLIMVDENVKLCNGELWFSLEKYGKTLAGISDTRNIALVQYPVSVTAYDPRGFYISLLNNIGVEGFIFWANINEPLINTKQATIRLAAFEPSEVGWSAEKEDVELIENDIIYYTLHIRRNGELEKYIHLPPLRVTDIQPLSLRYNQSTHHNVTSLVTGATTEQAKLDPEVTLHIEIDHVTPITKHTTYVDDYVRETIRTVSDTLSTDGSSESTPQIAETTTVSSDYSTTTNEYESTETVTGIRTTNFITSTSEDPGSTISEVTPTDTTSNQPETSIHEETSSTLTIDQTTTNSYTSSTGSTECISRDLTSTAESSTILQQSTLTESVTEESTTNSIDTSTSTVYSRTTETPWSVTYETSETTTVDDYKLDFYKTLGLVSSTAVYPRTPEIRLKIIAYPDKGLRLTINPTKKIDEFFFWANINEEIDNRNNADIKLSAFEPTDGEWIAYDNKITLVKDDILYYIVYLRSGAYSHSFNHKGQYTISDITSRHNLTIPSVTEYPRTSTPSVIMKPRPFKKVAVVECSRHIVLDTTDVVIDFHGDSELQNKIDNSKLSYLKIDGCDVSYRIEATNELPSVLKIKII